MLLVLNLAAFLDAYRHLIYIIRSNCSRLILPDYFFGLVSTNSSSFCHIGIQKQLLIHASAAQFRGTPIHNSSLSSIRYFAHNLCICLSLFCFAKHISIHQDVNNWVIGALLEAFEKARSSNLTRVVLTVSGY